MPGKKVMALTRDRLRILHLTAGSDAGGLSRYVFDLCSAMHDQGHEVAVAGQRGAWHGLFAEAPWPWIDVPMKGGPLALWQSARTLRRYLAEHPVDVLHAHYRRATLVARGLQQERRPPLLYTLHLSGISLAGPRRWFTDFGDHAHVAAVEAERWLAEEAGVDPRRITLIPHGIDPGRFPPADAQTRQTARQSLGISPQALVAVYVGRLDYPKNEHWLLDVAAAARDRLPDLRVLIAGEGPDEADLRRRIGQLKLEGRVTLLTGRRDPLPVYQAADAMLLPSLREGFSLVCAEAMSVGVPVLRTRTAGTQELIVENVTGRSVPIDHEAFVSQAVEFLCDRPRLQEMSRSASRHVREHFRFDRQVEQTMALYRRLSGEVTETGR